MLCDVVRCRCRWAHAPVIHAASHVDHKKRVGWLPISMHTYGPVSIIMEPTWQSFGPPELRFQIIQTSKCINPKLNGNKLILQIVFTKTGIT